MNDPTKTLKVSFAEFVTAAERVRGDRPMPTDWVSGRRIESQRRGKAPAMTFSELHVAIAQLRSWGIRPEQVRCAADLAGQSGGKT